MVRMGEPGIPPLSKKLFQHAFTSKYGKVRIFKIMNVSLKSKKWIADPANRVCDAPGSWYCTGQYPPALQPLIAKRKPFAQLEDFNTKRDADSQAYVDEYHKRMEGRGGRGGMSEDDGDDPQGGPGGMAGMYDQMGLAPTACYGRESALPADKVYSGGPTGASLTAAMEFAASQGRRYVAIAKASQVDGHAFAFNELPKKTKEIEFDDGCDMPCSDSDTFACGCADEVCRMAGASPLPKEEHSRRWVVYEVPPEVAMMMEEQQRKKAAKRKKKRTKPKSEL
mmetsp:Transcript_39197/g.103282  ORF Transcript_39197/g.103282 Transcript_39197/m.103282 type:complete len:281 (+) Transcript_39197:35-877(+)